MHSYLDIQDQSNIEVIGEENIEVLAMLTTVFVHKFEKPLDLCIKLSDDNDLTIIIKPSDKKWPIINS